MTNRFQTGQGENANDWKTRSFYNMIRGERWVLHQASEDPRGRIWHKVDKNGKVVDVKKGALNLGGNLAEWTKGGMGNLMGDKGDYQKNNLKVGSNKSNKKGNRGVLGWRSFADAALRDATDLDNMGPSRAFGTSLLGNVANQIDSSKTSKTSKKINLGNYKKEGYQHYIDSDGLDAYRKVPNKTKLKMTKAEKKWIKENPSGTFINSDGLDEAYSPEFDLIRARQAEAHKQWLIDNKRV